MSIIVFQHGATIGPGRLGATLRDHGFQLDIRRLDILGARGVPTDLDGVHGVVSLGGNQNVGEPHAWMAAELAFLKAAHARQLPVIGVCLGHQLIAHALGGKVGSMEKYHVGFERVSLNPTGQTETMLAGIAWDSMQYQDHGQEVKELPPDATLLASSPACRIECFKAGIRTYGFQYHFEADRAMMERWWADDAATLARCGASSGDLARACDANYPGFARLADRLCVNLGTFLFPVMTRISA
ncbi:MAG: type 1 glutamine amidotransferase [Phycisphaerales bacterium]